MKIITCQLYQDGDWQVEDEDYEDFSSDSSTDESAMITVEADVEIVQENEEESDLSLGTPMGEGRGYLGMKAHPPPFLSVQEYENHVQELNSAHYDGPLYDEYENYEGDGGEQEFDVPEVGQISEQDRYLAEFNAFYASYVEATHSYHREEDVPDDYYEDEANDDFEDERD